MELFDRTELIKELLIDQPWHEEKFVVCHELIDNLLFHSFGLQRTNIKKVSDISAMSTSATSPAKIR